MKAILTMRMKGDKLHSMNIFRIATDFYDNLRSEILECIL